MNLLGPFLPYIIVGLVTLAVAEGAALKHVISEKAALEAVSKQQAKEHGRELAAQKTITEDTKNGWQAALEYVRAHPVTAAPANRAGGVRNPGSGTLTGISGPAQGLAGPLADRQPDPAAGPSCDSQLADLTNACTETTVTCFALQTWVRRQREASEVLHAGE